MQHSRHLLIAIALLSGCRGAPSEEEPIVPIRHMFSQPRYNPQSRSEWFDDHRTMRPQVNGTVAREMEVDLVVASGWDDAQQTWALTIPPPVMDRFGVRGDPPERRMELLLTRGHQRFDIYCTPCHGYAGAGDGSVARRVGGAMTPPTFHSDRIRHLPDGQVYATITNGVRNMPSYRHSIPVADRWAIVGYLRALQLTQITEARASAGGNPDPGGTR